MSAQAEVTSRADGGEAPTGLRVRPPSPLSPRRRAAIAVVAVLLLAGGALLVVSARSADGGEVPGAAWRTLPVPRSARVDRFARSGPLGDVDGFGAWQTATAGFQVDDGTLRSTGEGAVATVDAGSTDVLVHAQILQAGPRGGLLLSSTPDGTAGLALLATEAGRWQLAWRRVGPSPEVIQTFDAPTTGVSVQVVRRGDRVRLAFDDDTYEVDVPSESAAGTFVGVTAAGPGNELELFGYLPLDVG